MTPQQFVPSQFSINRSMRVYNAQPSIHFTQHRPVVAPSLGPVSMGMPYHKRDFRTMDYHLPMQSRTPPLIGAHTQHVIPGARYPSSTAYPIPSGTKPSDLPKNKRVFHKVNHERKHRVLLFTQDSRPPPLPVSRSASIDEDCLDAASSLKSLASTRGGEKENPSLDTDKSKRCPRKCRIDNCTNSVVQGGLCIAHGARRKQCKHPGCTKNVKKAGLCSAHGPARKKCDHEGCKNIAVQGGRCISHGAKQKLCCLPNCTTKGRSTWNDMCKRHFDASLKRPTQCVPVSYASFS